MGILRGPKLSDRQFRWLTVIVSVPILVVSTKILIERTFFGAEQRKRVTPGLLPNPRKDLAE
ncbi:hypothetical protein AMAG_19797 [Allomyces macrogynus ATCC 38327]|uniref:Uncharacterized protein n=1 Tax=Allomyces macrogynus (strain ATCC 38327) TaxID=578462 RepID=A0A0L0T0P0_ALLM3|nr:hypothetical protein AMAG_19797 [Allomyces macrogynus ATCC 38327]|eukprot:KNE68353.1 hypothetical protein AMAG_19797 [Allomyces macrogynus ATCC 38327]